MTPSQLAIAWVLAKGEWIVPLIGARTRKQLSESLAALSVVLSAEDLERLEQAMPAAHVADPGPFCWGATPDATADALLFQRLGGPAVVSL